MYAKIEPEASSSRRVFVASLVIFVATLVICSCTVFGCTTPPSDEQDAATNVNLDSRGLPNHWISLEGGGFCAQTSYAGLLSGMMAATGVDLGELMAGFSGLSSNSGGSWFSSSLIYSSTYNNMLHAMATDPTNAEAIFNKSWTQPLLSVQPLGSAKPPESTYADKAFCYNMIMNAVAQTKAFDYKSLYGPAAEAGEAAWNYHLASLGKVQKTADETSMHACMHMEKTCEKKAKDALKDAVPPPSEMLDAMLTKASATGFDVLAKSDLSLVLGFAQTGGDSWENIVHTILEKTAGILPDTPLGSEPMAWAKGKTWHACNSLPTPQDQGHAGHSVWALQDPLRPFENSLRYNVTSTNQSIGSSYPLYTPMKFTYVLGSGQSELSEPVCATKECFGYQFNYLLKTKDAKFVATSSPVGDMFHEAYTTSGSQLPISKVAASSSAAVGAVFMMETSAAATSQCLNLATWTTTGGGGKAYLDAEELKTDVFEQKKDHMRQAALDKIAATGYHAHIDGAYTDNLGLGWAVASGAKVVTVLLNGAYGSAYNLFQLFGAPKWGVQPLELLSFKIFATSYEDAEHTVNTKFNRLTLPEHCCPMPNSTAFEHLNAISYGTIRTRTQENKWFNIKGGDDVELKVIWVNTTRVAMMVGSTYNTYNELIRDMMNTMTMPENKAAVTDLLENYFFQWPKEVVS